MRKTVHLLFVLVFLSHYVASQGIPSTPHPDEQSILRIIDEIGRAFVVRDASPFEKTYLDEYVNIRSKPIFNAKAHLIAMIKADAAAVRSGKPLDFETLSYESHRVQVRLYGQAAVVTAFKKNHWKYKNAACVTNYQVTELWVKQNVWRLAAGHSTQFQCENVPVHPLHPAVAAIEFKEVPEGVNQTAALEIREAISKAISSDDIKVLFTPQFVNTTISGELTTETSELVGSLRSGFKDDEVVQTFGDGAALYVFRIRPRVRTAVSGVRQFSVILIKNERTWQIAASHVSKPTNWF